MEKVEFFERFFEVENRVAFSPDSFVTIENFSRLIGEYNFVEKVVCQVEKNGGKCGHLHNKGWLGITNSGHEVLIGHICANKYFKADKSFSIEKKRIRNEIDFQRYKKFIDECVLKQSEIEHEMNVAHDMLKDVRRLKSNIQSILPDMVVNFILNAEKTKNRSVYIDIKYIEVDENKKEIISWVKKEIGKVKSASFFMFKEINDYYSGINDVRLVFSQIKNSNEYKLRQLKSWSEKLGSRGDIISGIENISMECSKFIGLDNLNLLLFMTSDKNDRSKILDLINNFHNGCATNAQQYIEYQELIIKQTIDGRDFRISR
ncbi:hypothetical protein KO533_22270 [Shewanella sp. NKUCC05_KAH]|uniref:hypothetical protein n=1 Tax=Shewanella sp. NKUCC05_KAH TaxID=2842126 RepID=UPI001C5A749E|nr:hypothetical protein [Shewanella sp. NKUCC05_KAH]MBW3529267.1 hypothetical protein [Shewanella sp. NKUCC05_KAH]